MSGNFLGLCSVFLFIIIQYNSDNVRKDGVFNYGCEIII
jgi:hypothetical protein